MRTRPYEHVVQFYDHEEELVESVSRYVRDALEADEVAIVVASAAHRSAFEAQMTASGMDVAGARGSGNLVVLDAEETMRQFLLDEGPDPDSFHSAVGDLLQSASECGRPVRVFGEIVAILWDAGLVNAAIELEALWNGMAQQYEFSLFCAYPSSSVRGEDQIESVRAMCDLHSHVVGLSPAPEATRRAPIGLVVTRTFDDARESPTLARRFVVETLREWGRTEWIDDAVLVANELAANAVVHAHSKFTMTVSERDGVRIAVRDTSPVRPRRFDPRPEDESGRGLVLVSALSRRWGTDVLDDGKGKVVWAELPR